MKHITTLFFTLLVIKGSCQIDSLNFESFTKYYQSSGGASYGNILGNVSKFTNQGVSVDMRFAEGRGKHMYGYNMNILISKKKKEFSIPAGYEHYTNPVTLCIGLFYGQTFGNQHTSHFQGVIGLDYGWTLHRKKGKKFGGYRGIVPKIEISRSIRFGKPFYRDYYNIGRHGHKVYDPSLSNKFVDIYVGYKQLLLNNPEGKGGLISIGIRYLVNKYSIDRNTKLD